jgi:broad specificity phosphatase PhoE
MTQDSARIVPGAITLVRHGRPALDRTVRLDWRGYRDWWQAYDAGGLDAGQTPPEELIDETKRADLILASPLLRAVETAKAVADGREIVFDPVFIEAPLPPPEIGGRRTPEAWGVWARVSWWLGNSKEMESREACELRAEAGAATLAAHALRGRNVILFAHGWFNRMMRPVLKRHGYQCVRDGGDDYWSFRRYETRR